MRICGFIVLFLEFYSFVFFLYVCFVCWLNQFEIELYLNNRYLIIKLYDYFSILQVIVKIYKYNLNLFNLMGFFLIGILYLFNSSFLKLEK